MFDFTLPDSDATIIYRDAGKSEVKASTFSKLIEKLTSENHIIDLDDFLLTYRSFSTAEELVRALVERYHYIGKDKAAQLRIFLVFRRWVEKYMYDFVKEPSTKVFLSLFLREIMASDSEKENIAKQLLAKVEKKAQDEGVVHVSAEINPSHPIQNVLDFSAVEIAQQLTLMEWNIWEKIKTWELLGLAWTKKDKNERAPNVVAMTTRFNLVSNWVASVFCTTDNIKARTKTLKKFLDIAEQLKLMGNFNGFMEIFSALQRGPCQRMKKAFQSLGKYEKKYDELNAITECTNHVKIREAISTIDPPVIPYLGMYLSDILFTHEGNPDYINGLINFYKCVKCSETIKRIKQYQLKGYPFQENTHLQALLMNLNYLEEKTLYDISYHLEPREGKEPGERPIELNRYLGLNDKDKNSNNNNLVRGRSFSTMKLARKDSTSGSDADKKLSKSKQRDRAITNDSSGAATASRATATAGRIKISNGHVDHSFRDDRDDDDASSKEKIKSSDGSLSSARGTNPNPMPFATSAGTTSNSANALAKSEDPAPQLDVSPVNDLIQCLERSTTPNDELVHALLAMHRYFACSEDLLKGLVRCFEGVRDPMELPKKQPGGDSPHAPTKQPLASKRLARLERILEIWLENYPDDFSSAEMTNLLQSYMQRNQEIVYPLSRLAIEDKVLRAMTLSYQSNLSAKHSQTAELVANMGAQAGSLLALLDYKPLEIAQALTLLAYQQLVPNITLGHMNNEVHHVRQVLRDAAFDPFNANDVLYFAQIIEAKFYSVVGFTTRVNEKNEKLFNGTDAVDWFKGILGLTEGEIAIWAKALLQAQIIRGVGPDADDGGPDYTIEPGKIYKFEKKYTDDFNCLNFVIDEFASEARRTVLTHLQGIRSLVYRAVEQAKESGTPELPAQLLNHFFQVAYSLFSLQNWHSFQGIIGGLHSLITTDNRVLWNSIAFNDLQWFFKMRKLLCQSASVYPALLEIKVGGLLHYCAMLDQLQLIGQGDGDDYWDGAVPPRDGKDTRKINQAKLTRLGLALHNTMRVKSRDQPLDRENEVVEAVQLLLM